VQIEICEGMGCISMEFSSRFKYSLKLIVSVSDSRLYFMKYIKKQGKKDTY